MQKNEILIVSSYPPRECGIATYSQDLYNAIKEKFDDSFSLKICALENKDAKYAYPDEVKYILNTTDYLHYTKIAEKINADEKIKLVFIQHEFGLFEGAYGENILYFLHTLKKPIVIAFHTVLPNPDDKRKQIIKNIVSVSQSIVVMTHNSDEILRNDYDVPAEKISVIHHGTHLVATSDKKAIKAKYNIKEKYVLSTFGLLSSGKCIETALDALPAIVKKFPNTLYCIIGITHPTVVKNEGEQYREFLKEKITQLGIENNVRFINKYLSLDELLEVLQITDIYCFTSKDPNQAVSGTLSYAMGCSCAVISTPIPHAKEMLKNDAGIIVDFQNADQLSQSAINLLSDSKLRRKISLNALHKIHSTSWQNSAVAHAKLFTKNINHDLSLNYKISEISLNHIKRLTTKSGIIQFADICNPDIESGFTLDDNARALIAVLKYHEIKGNAASLSLINIYLNFIEFAQQQDGKFLNYVDDKGNFHSKNQDENLEDSTGRAIWALGEFIARKNHSDPHNTLRAEVVIEKALIHIKELKSPRAISFAIKGLHHYNLTKKSSKINEIITSLADNLVSKYRGVSNEKWKWFEEYLTYANSVLPEALLYAYLSTGNTLFKTIAKASFDFLLNLTFIDKRIKVVSNNGWHKKGKKSKGFGEQPIDVTYTILSLDLFYKEFGDVEYQSKLDTAFSWFNGNNHLHQIIYNPVTGGCQDGLEEHNVNLNQGAESTVCYLLARMVMEKYNNKQKIKTEDVIFEPVISEFKKKIPSYIPNQEQSAIYQPLYQKDTSLYYVDNSF
jgi:glycosyltransferase involved in cell wall biosynthesis